LEDLNKNLLLLESFKAEKGDEKKWKQILGASSNGLFMVEVFYFLFFIY